LVARFWREARIPFLHVFSDNDSAIALYRRQGMEIRRRLCVTVLGKAYLMATITIYDIKNCDTMKTA